MSAEVCVCLEAEGGGGGVMGGTKQNNRTKQNKNKPVYFFGLSSADFEPVPSKLGRLIVFISLWLIAALATLTIQNHRE